MGGGVGLCMMSLPALLPGPLFLLGVGDGSLPGGGVSLSREVSVQQGSVWGTFTQRPPVLQKVATAAGVTHPTEMYSCFSAFSEVRIIIVPTKKTNRLFNDRTYGTFYHPVAKLWEGNVFTSVCLSTGLGW